MARLFIIYDERAISMGTDEASVCCTAKTLKEARRDVRDMFPGSPIYSYEIRGDQLVDEQLEEYKPIAAWSSPSRGQAGSQK